MWFFVYLEFPKNVKTLNSFCVKMAIFEKLNVIYYWRLGMEKIENLPSTMRLLFILFASSRVFPSLCVFFVISLPAKSTKFNLPVLEINTPPSAASSEVIWTQRIVWLRLKKKVNVKIYFTNNTQDVLKYICHIKLC